MITHSDIGTMIAISRVVFFILLLRTASSLEVPDDPLSQVPALVPLRETVFSTLTLTLPRVKAVASKLAHLPARSFMEDNAIRDCIELFRSTGVAVNTVITQLNDSSYQVEDAQTQLSAAMTNLDTCLEGLAMSKVAARDQVAKPVTEIYKRISKMLAVVKKLAPTKSEYIEKRGLFPAWLSKEDESFLVKGSGGFMVVNSVVAQDGSGNFTTISDALAAAPNNSTTRFVIYIKAGIYSENVEVSPGKTMIMFLGDGIDATVVRGNRSVAGGWTTFQSATVAVMGYGFVAKSITFVNDAGAAKSQAVALRSSADASVFYWCSFQGYQDTLYVHSFRQFYRDCDMYGTVDFIFGNAAAVLQNCNIYARLPMSKQKIAVTAQGRDDPNQNTGISIINCKIAAAPDFAPYVSSFQTFLGRPWKTYSRTVFMKSYIGRLVDPAGWLAWNGTFALDTLYYGEYMNTGPGSDTSSRVNWTGFRVINSTADASQFTTRTFIQGERWIGYSGVPYTLDLN